MGHVRVSKWTRLVRLVATLCFVYIYGKLVLGDMAGALPGMSRRLTCMLDRPAYFLAVVFTGVLFLDPDRRVRWAAVLLYVFYFYALIYLDLLDSLAW